MGRHACIIESTGRTYFSNISFTFKHVISMTCPRTTHLMLSYVYLLTIHHAPAVVNASSIPCFKRLLSNVDLSSFTRCTYFKSSSTDQRKWLIILPCHKVPKLTRNIFCFYSTLSMSFARNLNFEVNSSILHVMRSFTNSTVMRH